MPVRCQNRETSDPQARVSYGPSIRWWAAMKMTSRR